MTNSDLYSGWFISLGIAVVIILIAALLLIGILLVARDIRENARRALAAAEQIAADTTVIWQLDETNRVAEEILETTEQIEQRGGRIAETLQAPERVEH